MVQNGPSRCGSKLISEFAGRTYPLGIRVEETTESSSFKTPFATPAVNPACG